MNRGTSAFLTYAGGRAFVALGNLVVTVLVGRTLGPEGLGQWVLIVAAAAFLNTAFMNWAQAATVRFGAEEWSSRATLSTTLSARMPLLLMTAMVVTFLLLLQPFEWLTTVFGLPASSAALVGAYAASLWLASEAQSTLQATDRVRAQGILGPLAGAAAALGVWFANQFSGDRLSAVVLCVAAFTGVVWGVTWLHALRRSHAAFGRPSLITISRHVRYAAPLLAGFLIGYVSDWGDHLLLRHFVSVAQVGQFGIAYQVFLTLAAASGMLTTVLLPKLISSHAPSEHAERGFVEETAPTLFVMWGVAAALVVALVPPAMAWTMGSDFTSGIDALIVLCAVVPAQTITSLYTVLFSLQKRLSRVLVYGALMTAVNVAASLLLIPRLGSIGAAAATSASYGIVQIAYMLDQHRHLHVSTRRIMPVWLTLLSLGFLQVAFGVRIGPRLVWAGMTVLAVAWAARRSSAVSTRLVDHLFSGPLSPVAVLVRRTLVA